MTKPNKKDMQLPALQEWMQAALIFSGQKTATAEIQQYIAASDRLSAAQHLAIYQRSYYARLLACLQQQYKALHAALGGALFNDFGNAYLKTYPSLSPTLSELGSRFPAFLQQTRPDAAGDAQEPWIDFMIDLAQYEWDLYLLFDAPGHEGKPYASRSTPDENLILQPCFSLKKYNFPVNVYYREVAQDPEALIPNKEITFIALCRKDYRIGSFRLLPAQFYFLNLVRREISLPTALEKTANQFNIPTDKVAQAWNEWKDDWINAGFFIHKSK